MTENVVASLPSIVLTGSPPSWASGVSSDRERSQYNWAPQLQQAQPRETQPELDFAEPSLATFEFAQTQSAQDAEYARNAMLPPLESVLELTDAVRPPLRGEEPQITSTSSAGMGLGACLLCFSIAFSSGCASSADICLCACPLCLAVLHVSLWMCNLVQISACVHTLFTLPLFNLLCATCIPCSGVHV